MPKHVNRRPRYAPGSAGKKRVSSPNTVAQANKAQAGVMVVSGLWLLAAPAYAVTPLSTYFGPGLPLDNYFPEGVPGTAVEPGVTVRTRERPQYNSAGIRVGAFIIHPGFDETAGYDSNVVGGTINGKGSSELTSSANVSLNSNYNEDNFGFTGSVSNAEYWDVPRLNNTNYNVSFGGGLNLGRDVLYGSVSYQDSHELPYDIGTNGSTIIQLNKPLSFTDTDFRFSYSSEFGRVMLQPNVDYQLLRFSSGNFIGVPAGAERSFDQRLRNSNVLQGGVVARYEFQPQRDAIVVLNGNYNDYTSGNQPGIGVVNSTGATILVGLDYELSGATTVRALVGYQQRFFEGNTVSNQGAPIGELDFIWNPTGLTTVTAAYSRRIEDATTDTVTGYTFDNLSVVVDHELYRNILLQANANLQAAAYQGSSLSQTNYGAGAGVTYLVNRNIQLALSYRFLEHTSSNGAINEEFTRTFGNVPNSFGEHTVLLRFKFGI